MKTLLIVLLHVILFQGASALASYLTMDDGMQAKFDKCSEVHGVMACYNKGF